jgi:hypothetical protein
VYVARSARTASATSARYRSRAGGTITVDFIEFLTGDAATAAVQEENPEMDGAPDDYYVRDTEDVDVELDVADDVARADRVGKRHIGAVINQHEDFPARMRIAPDDLAYLQIIEPCRSSRNS